MVIGTPTSTLIIALPFIVFKYTYSRQHISLKTMKISYSQFTYVISIPDNFKINQKARKKVKKKKTDSNQLYDIV